ncbi:hypothetical protein SNF14_14305 [Winogradskyella aquimaris]|uniref:DUF5673 domain-containing protein n=2 Tax=Winogradskyella aquimaris TaxID=864074 RepID=A0ABU5EUW0_9FLAO|nr:hypothetical protein [Winogradskyella aquimaris]
MLKIIRITFYIVLSLFLLDIFDLFQTKIGFLKSIIYYGILILPIPLLIMEFKANRNLSEPILRKGIPILTIIGLIYLNPLKILFLTQTWKTQTVELINENSGNHKVELQMKDIGALGYAKRNAEVYYLTKYFYFVLSENYDDRNFIGTDWKRIDENINEIGLK